MLASEQRSPKALPHCTTDVAVESAVERQDILCAEDPDWLGLSTCVRLIRLHP